MITLDILPTYSVIVRFPRCETKGINYSNLTTVFAKGICEVDSVLYDCNLIAQQSYPFININLN